MKDHNIMSESGITDQEFVSKHNVPEELAGTPEINEWMINKVYEQNIQSEYERAVKGGMSGAKAKARARKVADNGKRQGRKTISEVKKARGY
jgi:uncharacterized protein YneF (UPF0154 family)